MRNRVVSHFGRFVSAILSVLLSSLVVVVVVVVVVVE